MIKYTIFIVIFISWISQESLGQIQFTSSFHCDKMENGDQVFWGYIERDECMNTFRLHNWKNDHIPNNEIMERLATKYGNEITFIPDENGIFVGQCRYERNYRYIIVIPNSALEIQYYSPCKGDAFGVLSKWILNEVKRLAKENGSIYFIDAEGKSCNK